MALLKFSWEFSAWGDHLSLPGWTFPLTKQSMSWVIFPLLSQRLIAQITLSISYNLCLFKTHILVFVIVPSLSFHWSSFLPSLVSPAPTICSGERDYVAYFFACGFPEWATTLLWDLLCSRHHQKVWAEVSSGVWGFSAFKDLLNQEKKKIFSVLELCGQYANVLFPRIKLNNFP